MDKGSGVGCWRDSADFSLEGGVVQSQDQSTAPSTSDCPQGESNRHRVGLLVAGGLPSQVPLVLGLVPFETVSEHHLQSRSIGVAQS